MTCNQMDLARILQLYVIQLIIAVFFLFLAYKVLKRDKKRLNLTFSTFYIIIALGLIINAIYALILNESIVLILNFITNFTTAYGAGFLTATVLIIWYSEKRFTKNKQLFYLITYGILIFLSLLLLPYGGVTINEGTNWKPVWSLTFYIYFISILTVFALIPFIFFSIKIYKDFKDEDLKKRWFYFLIGSIALYIYMYGAYTINLLNIPILRLIFSFAGLSVVLWIILIYYGVGRQLEKKITNS